MTNEFGRNLLQVQYECRQVSFVCDWHYRCGSRTEGPSGVRRRRRGASRRSWLSTGCTAPWYGTRYHFQISLSSRPRTASKVPAHLGCSVNIHTCRALSYTVHLSKNAPTLKRYTDTAKNYKD